MTFLKSLFDKKEEPEKSEDETRNEITTLKEYKIGDRIGGIWQIHRILGGEGKSGMGIVYVCIDNDKNIAALKTFQSAFLDSKEMKDNFRREALAWVHLEKHPYIVRAYFVEKLDYRLFIFLEPVVPDRYGRNTLTHYLKEPISLQQASEWGIQFCYGMEYAVSCGVTPHRDIKPDNIMIEMNKVLKITDFGLAKLFSSSGKIIESEAELAESGSKLTFLKTSRGKEIVGTLPWMAPEQFEGETDVRSDIYSFGLVMYQMMNRGNLPFYAKSIKGFEDAHKNAAVPKLNTSLFPIIARCLEKNPVNRYPDFNSLRMDLEALYSKETGKKPPSLPGKTELNAEEYFVKGLSFYSLDLIDDAIKTYKQAIAIKSDYAEAYSNMGLALSDKGQFDDAIKAYMQAIAIKSDYAEAYSNMGLAFQAKGQSDEAIKVYIQAIAIKPDFAEAYSNMGFALQAKGQSDEAIKAYEQAIAIKPDFAEAYFNMGAALQAKSQLDDAIKAYRQAITLKPDFAEAYFSMGAALQVKGQLDDAIKAYRQAITLKPDYADAYRNMGTALQAIGQLDDAIKAYRQAITLKADYAEAYSNMGAVLCAKGQFDEGIKACRQAIAVKPDYAEAYYNMGLVFQVKGQLEEAIKAYGQTIAVKPDHAWAHNNMGTALQAIGQLEEAIKAYRQAIAVKPDHAGAYKNMGIALSKVQKLNEAIDAFKKFIKYALPQDSQRIEQAKQNIRILQSRL